MRSPLTISFEILLGLPLLQCVQECYWKQLQFLPAKGDNYYLMLCLRIGIYFYSFSLMVIDFGEESLTCFSVPMLIILVNCQLCIRVLYYLMHHPVRSMWWIPLLWITNIQFYTLSSCPFCCLLLTSIIYVVFLIFVLICFNNNLNRFLNLLADDN